MVQENGIGGPYRSATLDGVLASLNGGNSGFAVGMQRPENSRGLVASNLTTGNGANQGWNWYRSADGNQRYLFAGVAGQWTFGNGSLTFSVAPQGLPHQNILQPYPGWQQLLQLDWTGELWVTQQIRVGREPVAHNEVATLDWVKRHAVQSFNGRVGDVKLELSDLQALVRSPDDPGLNSERIATTRWVQDAISFRLTDLLSGYPFVTTFNGRNGHVSLRLDDVMRTFFRRGARPMTPTPPPYDASLRIANTRWVEDRLGDIALMPGPVGPAGPQGPPGTGFNVRPSVPDEPSLPPTGNAVGDLIITDDTNTAWVWDGNQWNSIGVISPTSRVIVSDTPPLVANAGDLWWDSTSGELSLWYVGPSGSQWVIANTGIPGAQGPQGPPGTAGPDVSIGTTAPVAPTLGRLWYNPSNQTTSLWTGTQWVAIAEPPPPGATVSVGPTAPASPNNGDLWFDDSGAGELFVWYVGPGGGQWITATPAGAPGPQGPTGPIGPPGSQGVQGPPGTGLTFLGSVTTETALPATGNNVGDMYVTDDTQEMFTWDGTAWHLIGVGGGIPEAPTGMPGNPVYGRQNAAWVELLDDGTW